MKHSLVMRKLEELVGDYREKCANSLDARGKGA